MTRIGWLYCCLWSIGLYGQTELPPPPNPEWAIFERLEYQKGSQTMPYRLLLPEGYDETKSYPLVLFLHGAGERGTDNERTLTHLAPVVLEETHRTQYPAVVVVPQCPEEFRWVETDWKLPAHSQPQQPSVYMDMALGLLDDLDKRYRIDPMRRYVVGLSMGGFGVWDILMRRPDYFAAGVPVCGGGDVTKAAVLRNIPIWAFHGDKDKLVIPARSRDMVNAIRKAGGQVILHTEYANVGHGSWKPAFEDTTTWKWLFKQSKK